MCKKSHKNFVGFKIVPNFVANQKKKCFVLVVINLPSNGNMWNLLMLEVRSFDYKMKQKLE